MLLAWGLWTLGVVVVVGFVLHHVGKEWRRRAAEEDLAAARRANEERTRQSAEKAIEEAAQAMARRIAAEGAAAQAAAPAEGVAEAANAKGTEATSVPTKAEEPEEDSEDASDGGDVEEDDPEDLGVLWEHHPDHSLRVGYSKFDVRAVTVRGPRGEPVTRYLWVPSTSLAAFKKVWREADRARFGFLSGKVRDASAALRATADAYLQMLRWLAVWTTSIDRFKNLPSQYRTEFLCIARCLGFFGLDFPGLTTYELRRWSSAVEDSLLNRRHLRGGELGEALDRFRDWLFACTREGTIYGNPMPRSVLIYARRGPGRAKRPCRLPSPADLHRGTYCHPGYAPTPDRGLSAADLTAMWDSYGGGMRRERQLREEKGYEHPNCPDCRQWRYERKLEAKRYEAVLWRLHEAVTPPGTRCCQSDCPHVGNGMTAAQAKVFLNDIQRSILRTDAYLKTKYEEWAVDDQQAEIAARDDFIARLGAPEVSAAFERGHAKPRTDAGPAKVAAPQTGAAA